MRSTLFNPLITVLKILYIQYYEQDFCTEAEI